MWCNISSYGPWYKIFLESFPGDIYVILTFSGSQLRLSLFQNVLGQEGIGFKIAMGAFDKTRPPVSTTVFLER